VLAAARVFHDFGYAAARLDNIGQDAQVTKGALYFHFPSKAELARAVLDEHYGRWALIDAELSERKLDPLIAAVALSFEVARDYRESIIARAGERLNRDIQIIDPDLPQPYLRWINRLTSLLREARSQRLIRPDIEPSNAAHAIVASYFGIQQVSETLTDARDIARRLRDWWELMLPSLTGDPEVAAAVLTHFTNRGTLRAD